MLTDSLSMAETLAERHPEAGLWPADPAARALARNLVGGGRGAKPGGISLAHNGVLFMDEFPEFPRAVLHTLRQPIETGEVVFSRANAHVRYPCRFMLVAAANPSKCGYFSDPSRACARVPMCGEDYLGRISGLLMERFDLRVDVPPVAFTDLDMQANGKTSADIATRVAHVRDIQAARFKNTEGVRVNADAEGAFLEELAVQEPAGKALLIRAAETLGLSARGYHRVLRVARTIADLDQSETVQHKHIAEAISFRMPSAA